MCKRILVYEVIDSFVVEPEEVLKLEIEKNQDLLKSSDMYALWNQHQKVGC